MASYNNKRVKLYATSHHNLQSADEKMQCLVSALSDETLRNKKDTWNKLDRTTKVKLIQEFTVTMVSTYNLNGEELAQVTTYLLECLNKKRLQQVREVQYDRATGKILNIPLLIFNPSTRGFTLKRPIDKSRSPRLLLA
jgi:hypothetical protein